MQQAPHHHLPPFPLPPPPAPSPLPPPPPAPSPLPPPPAPSPLPPPPPAAHGAASAVDTQAASPTLSSLVSHPPDVSSSPTPPTLPCPSCLPPTPLNPPLPLLPAPPASYPLQPSPAPPACLLPPPTRTFFPSCSGDSVLQRIPGRASREEAGEGHCAVSVCVDARGERVVTGGAQGDGQVKIWRWKR